MSDGWHMARVYEPAAAQAVGDIKYNTVNDDRAYVASHPVDATDPRTRDILDCPINARLRRP
jgi:hypothetical protein